MRKDIQLYVNLNQKVITSTLKSLMIIMRLLKKEENGLWMKMTSPQSFIIKLSSIEGKGRTMIRRTKGSKHTKSVKEILAEICNA